MNSKIAIAWIAFVALAMDALSGYGQSDAPKAATDAKSVHNPVPYTRESVSKGKNIYLRNCQTCHGIDGRATETTDFDASDLTDPEIWTHGTTDGEIFAAIRNGAGEDMPPFGKNMLKDRQLWHLANFVHSLRPDARPLVEAITEGSSAASRPVPAANADPKKMKNPVPYNRQSIVQGRNVYARNCKVCHGPDGRALENIDFEAADLTAPETWLYGTTDGEIFVAIKEGAGDDMPPFKDDLKDEQMWSLVNVIRSIGPKKNRPEQKGTD